MLKEYGGQKERSRWLELKLVVLKLPRLIKLNMVKNFTLILVEKVVKTVTLADLPLTLLLLKLLGQKVDEFLAVGPLKKLPKLNFEKELLPGVLFCFFDWREFGFLGFWSDF